MENDKWIHIQLHDNEEVLWSVENGVHLYYVRMSNLGQDVDFISQRLVPFNHFFVDHLDGNLLPRFLFNAHFYNGEVSPSNVSKSNTRRR